MAMIAEHTPSITRGLDRLNEEQFDAVILDYRADQSSEEFLAKLAARPNKAAARC